MRYFLVERSGQHYLRQNEDGDYVPVKNVILATSWEQQPKAKNVLENCLNKNLRGRYKVIGVELPEDAPVKKIVVKPNEEFSKSIAKEEIADGESAKWIGSLDTMTSFIADSEVRKDELVLSLSNVDKEVSDILHYIEFGKFNAYQGYLAFNMLKQRLMKRRKIKDELSILQQIGECQISSEKLNNIRASINSLDNRKYEPRVLKELFEQVN